MKISSTTAPAGGAVTIPVSLTANGDEYSLRFSLAYSTSNLTFLNATVGLGASGATLMVNTNLQADGKVGLAVSAPPSTTFPDGKLELMALKFAVAPLTSSNFATISFADDPASRELTDTNGSLLPVSFVDGSVSITVALEADVVPRYQGEPQYQGDVFVSTSDWVLLGRFAAGLETPYTGAEFQRVDCAPRATLGDGFITVSDWVQAGRYAAKLDPATLVGGPTSEPPAGPFGSPPTPLDLNTNRELRVGTGLLVEKQAGTVSVNLESLGDENAIGFSMAFDPNELVYSAATLGGDAIGGTMNVNTTQAASGKLGLVLALPTGKNFTQGTREVIKLQFDAATTNSAVAPLTLQDQPVRREVSNVQAMPLATVYVNGTVAVNPLPSLEVNLTPQNMVLSWPGWATNYVLQETENLNAPPSGWLPSEVPVTQTNGQHRAELTAGAKPKFYRLRK